ncbi:MAG: hypothetical protein KDC85_10570 [Saprospiraceae bacterium]|nr:hypothetical protein [Saprospiraceae bacterium]MCB9322647.1 hypothetical protein [Lewinellaceae bacterium]
MAFKQELHASTPPVILLTLFCLLMLNSCGVLEKNTRLEELGKVIEMSKGPCFGTCPVFTLTVYDNGVVAYKGERFTDKLGLYIKVLKKGEFQNIVKAFSDANLWQFQDFYKSQVPDLQTVTLVYHEEGDIKTIVGKDGRPSTVLELENLLDNLVTADGWELKEKPTYGLPDNVKPDEIIVQLIYNVDATTWVRKYAKQEMAVVKALPSGQFWVIKFNKDIIPPREMIEFIRRDDYVISAQFNPR